MKVLIESAIKIDKEQQVELEKMLAKKANDAQFVYKVNPDVLGGLRVTLGSKRYDLSLKGKLESISKAIN